jgi:hypothetical protein
MPYARRFHPREFKNINRIIVESVNNLNASVMVLKYYKNRVKIIVEV